MRIVSLKFACVVQSRNGISKMRGSMLFLLLLLWRQESVRGLRLEDLIVPAHVAAGSEALLGCQFELEGDLLYSVKWYKDGREFFRYMPRGFNQTLRFPRPGVIVDMSRSSSDVVTLVNMQPQSAGLYRCEVSGEAPLFATVAIEKQINIHVLPKSGPRITGLHFQYDFGKRLAANCTSPGSSPEAQLKWLVNNRPVTKGYLRGPWHRVVQDPPDTTETILGLNFMVLPSHFKSDVMEIKCQATIPPLYQREKAYILSKPDETEESFDPETELETELEPEPDPKPDSFDISDKEIQENIIGSFHELANTFEQPRLTTTTTTEKPNEQNANKAYDCLSKKSLAAMLLTLLLEVILLL